MKKRKVIWTIILLLALVGVFLFIGFGKPEQKVTKAKPDKKVDGYIVKPSLLVNEIIVNGSLQAFESVDLKNEIAGRVVMINLPEGKFVRKGTVLVKLFDDDLQAQLRKLQAQLAIQEQIYKRQSELVKVNGITQNDYEQNGLLINSLKSDIEIQKAQIRKTEVVAPFDGVIGLRNISVGAIVTPSTLLATIRTTDKLKLDFFVPEKYILEMKPGMKLKFTTAGKENEYEATVIATEQGIDDATRNLKVRAEVNKNHSNDLLSGAFANIKLRLKEDNNALMIPTQAIIPQENKKMVVVVRNGIATFVEVKSGIRKSASIEITEGLQPGDTIATSGLLFIKENTKLDFKSVNSSL